MRCDHVVLAQRKSVLQLQENDFSPHMTLAFELVLYEDAC